MVPPRSPSISVLAFGASGPDVCLAFGASGTPTGLLSEETNRLVTDPQAFHQLVTDP